MGQNFISCDREQVLLLPPSLMDWLSEDHLVWSVLGAVEHMNLDRFYASYRANGQGRAACDPQMMAGLLLYSYCVGVRSSRQIERACRCDVAFKVICSMLVPDHSTIAEFRRRHETAGGELFVEVLALCAEAGLVMLGDLAVDGTKLYASASYDRNLGYASIVEEILEEGEQTDRQEDDRFGPTPSPLSISRPITAACSPLSVTAPWARNRQLTPPRPLGAIPIRSGWRA